MDYVVYFNWSNFLNDEEDFVSDALDVPESDRLAFVDIRCGSDSGSIPLGQTIGLIPTANSSNKGRSLVAGLLFDQRFRLIQRIGEGGMGEVWVADQLKPIKRRVAIKDRKSVV